MKSNIVFCIIIAIVIVMSSGCAESNSNQNTYSPEPTITNPISDKPVTTNSPNPTSMKTSEQYDDKEYLEWVPKTGKILANDLDMIEYGIKSDDMNTVVYFADVLETDARHFNRELKEFKLSPSLQLGASYYSKALSEYATAGYCYKNIETQPQLAWKGEQSFKLASRYIGKAMET